MAVVPYNSDVLCMHKTRLQLMYTDVHQLKMVQMVSQPQLFCGLDQLVCCDDPSFKINCGKFWKNFPRKECNRQNGFRAVAPIRLRLVCLGLLNLDGYGCPKSLLFQRACLQLGHGILLPRLKELRCGLGQYGYYLSKSV